LPQTKLGIIINALKQWDETFSTAMHTIRSYGFRAFLKSVRDALRAGGVPTIMPDISHPIQPLNLDELPSLEESTSVESANAGVSVVIPTLNGANDLVKLLPSLYSQQGFKKIEIIIVDSGSTDDTLSLAKAYGANVLSIAPKEFSHSHARNIGADSATQEYLFFTVQDALLPSSTSLVQMLRFMERENLSAVSCKELPRMDADLYARVENWYHYKEILKLRDADKVLSKPTTNNPQSLRESAQLSNVACLMPKNIFKQYRFRGEYAEDLDLGLRLINDGAKVGIMNSVNVIHSHTRSPYEYLKRGFVDKFTIAQLLNEPMNTAHPSFHQFIQDVFYTGKRLRYIHNKKWSARSYVPIAKFERKTQRQMMALLLMPLPPFLTEKDFKFSDSRMKEFLQLLYPQYHRKVVRQKSDGNLLRAIMAFTRIIFAYLRTTHDVLDEHVVADVRTAIHQYYATLVGRCIAEWYLIAPEQEKNHLEPLKEELLYGEQVLAGLRR